MRNIVLYAPPAAGKGTLCESLVKEYGYSVVSIGDVLRNQRSDATEIGRTIIRCQDQGILVPDDIVKEALKCELIKYQGKPIIIDGYPRNIDQAKVLDTIVENYVVINIDVPRDIAMKRTIGRRTCKNCNKIYNIYFEAIKPLREGICDICGSELSCRSDDNANSFNVRYDVYETNADKILNYYKEKNILFIVDGSKQKEEIFKLTKAFLEGNK